jgi:hypothetical protein
LSSFRIKLPKNSFISVLFIKRNFYAFSRNFFPDAPVVARSGGEVDPETGNAFFYTTREELKTINSPLVSRRADGREEHIGFTSTTTKVITDEKHWLTKQDPDQMEEKSLAPRYSNNAPWPTTWTADVQDPLADPQEFLLNFPTLADHGLAANTSVTASEYQDIDLTRKISAANLVESPRRTFQLPKKSALSANLDDLAVESALTHDFKQYIGTRL